jgi:hypothetical protein
MLGLGQVGNEPEFLEKNNSEGANETEIGKSLSIFWGPNPVREPFPSGGMYPGSQEGKTLEQGGEVFRREQVQGSDHRIPKLPETGPQ